VGKSRLFQLEYVLTEPTVDGDEALARWRTALNDAFGSCDVTRDDALAGFGGRLSAPRPAADPTPTSQVSEVVTPRSGSPSSVITRPAENPDSSLPAMRAFGMARVKARLAEDLADGAEPLKLHKDGESFLIGLGEQDEVELDPEDVRARALPLIKSGLERSPLLPRAVFDRDFYELDFRTEVTDGTIEAVERARRFVGDRGEILLIDATWRLDFRLLYACQLTTPCGSSSTSLTPRARCRSTLASQTPRLSVGSSSRRSSSPVRGLGKVEVAPVSRS